MRREVRVLLTPDQYGAVEPRERVFKGYHVSYLKCSRCGKQVSTGFLALPTVTPDKGLIVRAWIECPECIESREVPRVGD